jgi:hypothetical protein
VLQPCTLVANADIVPYVSFSKVSELQSQIVSAAWEQQVLKKWREATKAMSAACANPRPGKEHQMLPGRGGAAGVGLCRLNKVDP